MFEDTEEVEGLLSIKEFERLLKEYVWEYDITYLDALWVFCERYDKDYIDLIELINQSKFIKEKIEFDAIKEGKLKRSSENSIELPTESFNESRASC
jgi:hypothetical protein